MEQKIRVLLVDNDESFTTHMGRLLEKDGFEVDTATSGRAALKLAREHEGNYHVAVIDQVMGPPNGTETMLKLRKAYPGIEAILLTGWGDMEPGERAMELGAFRYLAKSPNPTALSLDIRCAARFGLERQHSQSLQRLLSAGQRVGGVKTEREVYQQIYTEVRELLPNLDGFLISNYSDRESGVEFPFAYRNGKPVAVEPRKQGNSITEYVLRTRQPLLLPWGDKDFRKEKGLNPPSPRLGYCTSEIVVPMFHDQRIIGTISAATFDRDTHYTTEQLQVLQAFSNQAAFAIINVRQLEEAEQLKNAVSALASKRGRKAIIETIVRQANKLIDCDFTGLILLEEDGSLHKVKPVIPAEDDKYFDEPRQQGGVTREVVTTRKPRVIQDTFKDPLVKDGVRNKGIHSMLVFPLCYGDQVLGVLYGHHYSTLYFSDHDVELWTAFTSQAAVALHNALEDERRAGDLKRFEQVKKALLGGRDIPTTMEEVTDAAMKVFESDTSVMAYVEPTTGRILEWKWSRETPAQYLAKNAPRSEGVTNYILNNRKSIYRRVSDRLAPPPLPEHVDKGLKAFLAMPLLINRRIVGILYCHYFNKREPDYERLQYMIPAFSSQAATALFRSRRDLQNAIWHDLDQKIVSCNHLKQLYREFLQHAHQASGADFSVFYPFDPTNADEKRKTLREEIIYEGELKEKWQMPAGGTGGGVTESLLHSRNDVMIVNDLESYKGKYASAIARREGVKAFVAVRLMVTLPGTKISRLAGILFHNFRTTTDFEKRDLASLESEAASVAQAILRLELQVDLQIALEERKKLIASVTEILHTYGRENRQLDLNVIATQVARFLGDGACIIMEYDRKSGRFFRRGLGGVRHPDKHYTIPREFKTRFMDHPHCTVIRSEQADQAFDPEGFIKREDIVSTVVFPLRMEGEALGLLFADSRTQAVIPQQSIDSLSLFADFAALVLHDSQLRSELVAMNSTLNRGMFLFWVSMIEDTWRHDLVQRAATILNLAATLKAMIIRTSPVPAVMKGVEGMIETINQEAHAIADAPPRVPQSWEAESDLVPIAPLVKEVARRELKNPLDGKLPPIKTNFQLEPLGGVSVRGYRRWLIYALEALLMNSRRAMPEGGTITISGDRADKYIEIRMQDTGDGIPPEVRSRLFRELIPPKDDRKGMGIGALLVANIIEFHGGDVTIDKPGPGDTTILVRLPYIKEQ